MKIRSHLHSITFTISLLLSVSFSLQSLASPAAYLNSNHEMIVNGKTAEFAFWSGSYDVGEGFASNPLANKYYEEHKHYGRLFSILNWGALGAALTYSASTVGSGSYNSGTFWTIFLIPWLGGIYCAGESQKNMTKAINIYNGVPEDQAEFRQKNNRNQFSKNDLGFAYQWEF